MFKMQTYNCKNCKDRYIRDVFIKENGNQVGLYCSNCGSWLKWLGKDERRLIEKQMKGEKPLNNKSTNNNNSINKNIINKILECVTQEENKYYKLSNKELDEDNIIGMQLMTAQASAFQRVRYLIEDLIEKD